VHREAESGLDDLFVSEDRPEREHDLRDLPRQDAGQLHSPALREEIDDGQIEAQAPHGGMGLGRAASHVDHVPPTPEEGGQGVARLDVAVDE
jgi:hypothetical protein